MISTVLVLVPIFALIVAGYACRLRGLLGAHATSEINRLVVWLALPAVLFDIMANTSFQALYQPHFFLVFLAASLLVFSATLLWQLRTGKHLADACLAAMSSAYPNVGFIGFPLLLVVFGKSSLMPTTIATIIVVCIVFAIVIALIETGLQTERHPRHLARKVCAALLKNPLIIAPLLGVLCSATGVVMPAGIEQFLKLLGAAASPCALVCIGLFLADQRLKNQAYGTPGSKRAMHAPAWLSLIKLGVQPAVTWLLAFMVMPLATDMRHMAVLLAALPTGTGPFMLAEYYRRDGVISSNVILISTVASMATLAVLMSAMGIAPR
jgi:malonate transporter